MIRKLLTKAIERIKDPSRSLRERVFLVLTLLTDVVVVLALRVEFYSNTKYTIMKPGQRQAVQSCANLIILFHWVPRIC